MPVSETCKILGTYGLVGAGRNYNHSRAWLGVKSLTPEGKLGWMAQVDIRNQSVRLRPVDQHELRSYESATVSSGNGGW